MDRRMRVIAALTILLLIVSRVSTFIPGADGGLPGPVSHQEALEGGNTTFFCDSSVDTPGDQLMLLVWYKNNAPIYSYDARIDSEWSSASFNATGRLTANLSTQPTALSVALLREDDEALYHCRVDFLVSPTRNVGVNLTVIVLPSKPFFLDEIGNKVEENIGPYHEGDTLVLSCLVIGGRPPPRISWYSGATLVDASDGASDIPGVKENELYLPLSRDNVGDLSCRASNTLLSEDVRAVLKIELYLPAFNVSIHWVKSTVDGTLEAGKPTVLKCTAFGSYPAPELSWWLDHRHLMQHSNQSAVTSNGAVTSHLELTPSIGDNGATLACVATNPAMAPSRGSKTDVITLNVTYSPIVEITKVDGRPNDIAELDKLQLECEVKANPPVDRYIWYFNDLEIEPGDIWGDITSTHSLTVEECRRHHAGSYSCAAANSVGETRAEPIRVTVFYPPECTEGVVLIKEIIHCNVQSLPTPDTFFWHIQPSGLEEQHLTTGSSILHLAQITGPLSGSLKVVCKASNGISTQEVPCEKTVSLEQLRPQPPQQCDLAFEFGEFQMRCIPVENATYYEVSVWRLSISNSSLILDHRGSMGFGTSQALAHGGLPWLVRGGLGMLGPGDEAGASACNRYGCSTALLLRPTEILLQAASPPWWDFFLSKDVGISLGAVVLIAVFFLSTCLAVRIAKRVRTKPPAPVIQVLQLDEVARDYLETIGDHKVRASCSIRSCSSGYSDGSMESAPTVDRRRKPRLLWDQWEPPPPDVTLTLHRESAV